VYMLTRRMLSAAQRRGQNALTLVAIVMTFALTTPPLRAGDIILTITGLTGEHKTIDYSLSDIEAMNPIDIVTSTPWTIGQIRFTGVPLSQFLHGQDSGTLRMVALNDFIQNMPVADIDTLSPIIAFAINGERMSVRDKGPLWMIYPFDSDVELQTETFYARSVWQLRELHLLP